MANYVKISTVAPSQQAVLLNKSDDLIVQDMLDFWAVQFAQVLPDRPDLIVVPEACDIPGNFQAGQRRAEYYEVRKNRILEYFAKTARENRCYIVYSSNIYGDDGRLRNSSIILDRSGEILGRYNKNYIVPDEYDKEGILYGREASVVECDFGRVGCAICFDLNFDQLRQQYAEAKPGLIVFPSLYHGGLMQSYWAYSCRCHFIGSVAGLPSEILNPYGKVLASTTNYRDFVTAEVNLDCVLVKRDLTEERYLQIRQKYGPKVQIDVPQHIGVALISSRTDEFTACDILKEFGIETLDEYFGMALEHRNITGHIE